MAMQFESGDVLVLIDLQCDAFAGGAMAVPRADEIVPLVNDLITVAQQSGVPIVATRDWHPANHVSFIARGGSRPAHCVHDTPGAALHADLHLPPDTIVVSKGTDAELEPISAFDGTDLAARLHDVGARRLCMAGLSLDETVGATALDAVGRDFDVVVIAPATRGRRVTHPADRAKVLEELQSAGVIVQESHAAAPAHRLASRVENAEAAAFGLSPLDDIATLVSKAWRIGLEVTSLDADGIGFHAVVVDRRLGTADVPVTGIAPTRECALRRAVDRAVRRSLAGAGPES